MKHPVLACSLFVSLLVMAFLAHAFAMEKCVAVRVTNCHARTVSVAYGPVTLCAETRVTPDAAHRYLETAWNFAEPDPVNDIANDPDDHVPDLREPDTQNGAIGSSLRSLDGEREHIRHDVKLHHLEGGTYLITSTVYSDEARKKVCGRATARVMVH